MSLIPPWLRPTRVRERLASYHLRSDVLDAAAAMASDQRSDIYIVRRSPLSLTICCTSIGQPRKG